MAWTQSDIDALKVAIASGILRVRHGEKDVTYQSLADMQRALRMMQAEVTTAPRNRMGVATVVRS